MVSETRSPIRFRPKPKSSLTICSTAKRRESSNSITLFGPSTATKKSQTAIRHRPVQSTSIRKKFGDFWVRRCSTRHGKVSIRPSSRTDRLVLESHTPLSVMDQIQDWFLCALTSYLSVSGITKILHFLSKLKSKWSRFIWKESKTCSYRQL